MEANLAIRIDEPKKASAGFEPETILPSQFFDRLQIDASLQPERRLMLAVLEDAVGAFQKHVISKDRRGRRLFAEAEEWFASEDRAWPYAFANICEALDLNAEFLHRGLWRWRDKQRLGIDGTNVVRFPFRRVNGTRHAITGRAVGLRKSA